MLGSISWYQLLVYRCDSCLISLFMLLSDILQFSYLSCYLVSYICSCSSYYFMHIVYMHEFFPLHTHSPGRFLMTLDLHVQILDACSIVQVFNETIHIARSLSLSLILVFSSLLYSCYFLILSLSHSAAIFFPLFICYHCVRLYMYYCSDHWLLWFRFIACSG